MDNFNIYSLLYGMEQAGFGFVDSDGDGLPDYDLSEGLFGLNGYQEKIYQDLTDRIIKMIDKQPLFWRKEWKSKSKKGLARNFKTKSHYSGINNFLLNMFAPMFYDTHGITITENWLTKNQIKELGGKIKKGGQADVIYYFNFMYRLIIANDGVEIETKKITKEEFNKLRADGAKIGDKTGDLMIVPFIKYYRVFNEVFIEGIDFGNKKNEEKPKITTPKQKIATCEFIVDCYTDKPPIYISTNGRAYFETNLAGSYDAIHIPKLDDFNTEQAFYSTLFHELAHSTGSQKRLNRESLVKSGKLNYAKDELVAEFTALFLCADAGIAYSTLDNSAAYLQGWNKSVKQLLQDDKKAIFRASADAQKARDYIMKGNSLDNFNPENYEFQTIINPPKHLIKIKETTKLNSKSSHRIGLAKAKAKALLLLQKQNSY